MRLTELRYLILEYEITPPEERPLSARVNYPKWVRELRRLETRSND